MWLLPSPWTGRGDGHGKESKKFTNSKNDTLLGPLQVGGEEAHVGRAAGREQQIARLKLIVRSDRHKAGLGIRTVLERKHAYRIAGTRIEFAQRLALRCR